MKILFVCKANIVRSFAAERMLKKALKEKKRSDIEVSSAAIYDMNGESADPMAGQILKEMGFEADDHYSKFLTEDIAAEADMILVMEQSQKDYIIGNYPDTQEKVFLLKSFSKGTSHLHTTGTAEIEDPYNQSSYHYRLRFSEIYMAVQDLVKECI